MNPPVRKAVLPVAGLGTRFLPATKAMAKEMLPVVDKPLIQYAIEEARAAGIEDFVLVTGRGKTIMEDHFDHAVELEQVLKARGKEKEFDVIKDAMVPPGHLAYVRQQDPLGLGHAIWCARQFVAGDPFAVLLPDDLVQAEPGCLAQMVAAYEDVGGNIVAVEDVPRDQTDKYGILDVDADEGRLVRAKGLVEKPKPEDAPSTLSIIGRYILQPQVFEHLDRHEKGAGGEIQLTDAMAKTLGTVPFHGLRFEGRRFDCGSKVGFIEANVAFAMDRPELADRLRTTLKTLI